MNILVLHFYNLNSSSFRLIKSEWPGREKKNFTNSKIIRCTGLFFITYIISLCSLCRFWSHFRIISFLELKRKWISFTNALSFATQHAIRKRGFVRSLSFFFLLLNVLFILLNNFNFFFSVAVVEHYRTQCSFSSQANVDLNIRMKGEKCAKKIAKIIICY